MPDKFTTSRRGVLALGAAAAAAPWLNAEATAAYDGPLGTRAPKPGGWTPSAGPAGCAARCTACRSC